MAFPRLPEKSALLTLWLTCLVPAQATNLTTLYSFQGGTDGSSPHTGVTLGAGGAVYGTTADEGAFYHGTAFSLTPPASAGGPWTENVYAFPNGKGYNGAYGTFATRSTLSVLFNTDLGPPGMVFALRPPTMSSEAWSSSVLHTFSSGSTDGQFVNSVILGLSGVLYGTTQHGGTGGCDVPLPGCGTVFSLTPPASQVGAWTEAILYNFTGYPNDGNLPAAGVIIGAAGVLYGTTSLGGNNNSGTVFSLTPPASAGGAWTETVLYSFPAVTSNCRPGQLAQGSGPSGHIVLYGATFGCGASNEGMVFSLTPPDSVGGAWTQTILHNFAGGSNDGAFPGALVVGANGVIYGTTSGGGPANQGTVFSLTPPATAGGAWTEAVLYFFTGAAGGGGPNGLTIDINGILYGTTSVGGASNHGTVFSLTP